MFLYQGPNFILGVLLTQLSLLFLYRRIFSLSAVWFRRTYYALLFFVLGINVPLFFVTLFQCNPFRFAWDKSVAGHCINIRHLYLAHTVLILVLDLCIVAAPMPHVRRLHTTAGTKGAVAGMFLLGGLSVLRPEGDRPKNTVADGWSHAVSVSSTRSGCPISPRSPAQTPCVSVDRWRGPKTC